MNDETHPLSLHVDLPFYAETKGAVRYDAKPDSMDDMAVSMLYIRKKYLDGRKPSKIRVIIEEIGDES